MDPNQIVAIVSCCTGLAAVLSPILSSLITRRQSDKDRAFDFNIRRSAEAKERFLSAAANCLRIGAGGIDTSQLLDAYGNVSFYVSENIRKLMFELCHEASELHPNVPYIFSSTSISLSLSRLSHRGSFTDPCRHRPRSSCSHEALPGEDRKHT